MNNYITEGYEQYVGSKADIWARRSKPNIKRPNTDIFKYSEVILHPWALQNLLLTLHENRLLAGYRSNKEFLTKLPTQQLVHPSTGHIISLAPDINSDPVGPLYQHPDLPESPSSGVFYINYMLMRYKRMVIYGFDHFTDIMHHYYGDRAGRYNHNPIKEKKLCDSLIEAGRLIYLQDFLNV